MGYRWLTEEQKEMARRMRAKGQPYKVIVRAVGSSVPALCMIVQGTRAVTTRPPFGWTPAPGRLGLEEREEIVIGLSRGESFASIARQLGRSTSTVSREVAANGGRDGYRAWSAFCRARDQARRPKETKLGSCPRLQQVVSRWLIELWSPDEIARRLRIEFPDDPMMWVSHETIYKSLFVQGRGELRRELARCLRTGRTTRRPRSAVERRGRLPGMVMISDRPAEIEDRAVPGHWEGDLIIGADNKSAVGTLVERHTRYVMLLHLPDDFTAATVDRSIRKAIKKLPGQLFKTLTWDQGAEMALHSSFTVDTGIQIYFCDPRAPWQRGSNENTNGLLRQYMPKGTDLSLLSPKDLDHIARSLNNRPRKTLGYMKPSEKLAEFLALTG
jgi:transposase, IS30 family